MGSDWVGKPAVSHCPAWASLPHPVLQVRHLLRLKQRQIIRGHLLPIDLQCCIHSLFATGILSKTKSTALVVHDVFSHAIEVCRSGFVARFDVSESHSNGGVFVVDLN